VTDSPPEYDDSISAIAGSLTDKSFFDVEWQRKLSEARVDMDAHSKCASVYARPISATLAPWLRNLDRNGRSYLDNRAQSQTPVRDGTSSIKLYNHCAVYPSGELSITSRAINSSSKPPPPTYGPKYTQGVSKASARRFRRAVIAKNREGGCQFVMLTLTSQTYRSDKEMGDALEKLLAWGRKYLPKWFSFYVWAAELQTRGVLHFHLLLPYRIPKGMFRRLRNLWAEKYEMGPGSVHILKLNTAKGAASYLSKMAGYVVKGKSTNAYRPSIDAGGMVQFEPWRVNEKGVPYERIYFRGRASDMSREAREYSFPEIIFEAPWGAFPNLGIRGGSFYFDSPSEAVEWLSNLTGPSP